MLFQQGLWFLPWGAPTKELPGEGAKEGIIIIIITIIINIIIMAVFIIMNIIIIAVIIIIINMIIIIVIVIVINSKVARYAGEFFDENRQVDTNTNTYTNKDTQTQIFKYTYIQILKTKRKCELVFGLGSLICSYMPPCKRLWCSTPEGEVKSETNLW